MASSDIVAAVNSILAGLKPSNFPHDSVNWGDLACVNARILLDHDGTWCWMVEIEEADPGHANDLRWAVEKALQEQGIVAEVFTEW